VRTTTRHRNTYGSTAARLGALAAALTAALAVTATPALAAPSATLFVVASGGATTGSYPAVCSAAAPCSLTLALTQVSSTTNVSGDAVTINLAPGTYAASPYNVTSSGSDPNSLAIKGEGAGPSSVVLYGGGTAQVLNVDVDYGVTVHNLTLEDGSGGLGPNLLTQGTGTTTLDHDIVTAGNSPGNGQAEISGAGTLAINYTTVENAATGTDGALAIDGTLNIDESALLDNGGSGADVLSSAALEVISSTLDSNSVAGVFDSSSGMSGVDVSTITNNAFAGIATTDGDAASEDIEAHGDILANNAGTDCVTNGSPVGDSADNVTDDSTCGLSGVGDTTVSTAAIGLLPPAFNGGPTETERITASSAAANVVLRGPMTECSETPDQRGLSRAQGPLATNPDCDAGAYQIAPPTLSAISTAEAEPGTALTLTGTNLDFATAAFGATPATVTAQSDSSLTVTVPPLSVGPESVTVSNADGTASFAFNLSGPTITTTSFPPATVGTAYVQMLTAAGGVTPLSFRLASGALPAGLALSSAGAISGTPTSTAAASFTIAVTDADGARSTDAFTLSVVAAVPVISIETSSVKLKHSKGSVTLACASAACNGTLELTTMVREKVTQHHKVTEKTVTVVLASGQYTLTAGVAHAFTITVTAAGRRTLAHVGKHSLHETLLAALTGGTSVTAQVKVT
jgi:hypothetical protein